MEIIDIKSCLQCGGTFSKEKDKFTCNYCGHIIYINYYEPVQIPSAKEKTETKQETVYEGSQNLACDNEKEIEVPFRPSTRSRVGRGISSAIIVTLVLIAGGFAVTLLLSIISLGGVLFSFETVTTILEIIAFVWGASVGFFLGFKD